MPRSLYGKLHRRFGPKLTGSQVHDLSFVKRQAIDRWLASRPKQQAREPIPVIIVGGGFAGLAAAWYLVKCHPGSFNITVLEARSRVGGRVLTFSDHPRGRLIEAGGELIGMNHPLWLELAREFGLGLSVLTSEDESSAAGLEPPLRLGGRLLPPIESSSLYGEMTDVLGWLSCDAAAITAPYAPWTLASPKIERWDRMSVAQRLREKPDLEEGSRLWQAIRIQLENDNLLSIEQQSYLGLLCLISGGRCGGDLNAYWTATEVYRCERGNAALANELRARLVATGGRRGVEVLTGKQVISFKLHEENVSVRVAGESTARLATHLILATPPPTWPPGFDLAAAYVPSTGPAIKYLSPVKKRFWIEACEAASGMSEELGMTWEGTDNQMETGSELELTVFAGGQWAKNAMDANRSPKDLSEYFAKRIEALLPGYTTNTAGEAYFANWPEDNFTLCGYSCPSLGQVLTVEAELNDPPFGGRMFFAGEHVCTAYFGYMEGALQSGYAAASRVAAAAGLGTGPHHPALA